MDSNKLSIASNGLPLNARIKSPSRHRNERDITVKNVLRIIFSLSFLRYVALSFVLSGAIALTYIVSLDFFRFMITFFISSITLMIFTVFSLSQTRIVSGFFMTVGFGYGFVGLFTILQRAAYPLQYIGGRGDGNYQDVAIQIWISARYIEIISFVIGIIFVKRTFSGARMRVAALLSFVALSTLMLFSIFFNFFPKCYDLATGTSTNFHKATEAAFVFSFLTIGLLFTIRRRSFHINVYSFLLVALFFRILSCVLNSTIYDWSGSVLAILSLVFRAISFLFIFISMGVSTLQNPVETLFRNLIDKQAALENERMFSEWMIEQFPTLVVLLDSTGKITHVNNFSLELLQFSKNDVLAQDFFELFTSENRESHRQKFQEIIQSKTLDNNIFNLQAFYSKQNKVIEWTCKSLNFQNSATPRSHSSSSISLSFSKGKSGRDEPKSITLEMEPIERTDEKIIVLCLGQDVTERRQRENLLLEARNEAEKLSLLKDTFVANVSHELRTPLNCIVGVTSLLLQTKLLAQQQEMVEMITTASNSLVAVINDLLDFSSIQQGKLKIVYSQLNLRKFVEEVIVSISVLYQASMLDFGFKIEKDCPDLIFTDEKRVRQILMNLLSNAIKFTQQGQVIVTVERSKEMLNNSTALLFKVIDSGIGIKDSDKDKLFERFSQIEHNYTRKFQGTGIGLTLCKELISLLGGHIGLESEFGRGSTFWFVIPTQGHGSALSPKSPNRRYSHVFSSPVNLKDSYRKHKTYMFLKNPNINELLCQNLSLDYGFNLKKVDSPEQMKSAIQKYASKYADEPSVDPNSLAVSVPTTHLDKADVEQRQVGRSLTVVYEGSTLDELDLQTLRSMYEKKIDVHLIIVSPAISNNFVNIDIASTGIPTDIIGKPIRNSLLVQHLQKKKRRMSLAPQSSFVHTNLAVNFHSLSTDSGSSEEKLLREDVPQESTKILLVEDNVTNQKVIQMLLKRIGNIEYDIACNGLEAVEKFKVGQYDLVLMDCQMPVMDGYTATTEIRRIEKERNFENSENIGSDLTVSSIGMEPSPMAHIPIVALTANAMEADREKCLKIGMDDYLTKPIILETLRKKLEYWQEARKRPRRDSSDDSYSNSVSSLTDAKIAKSQ